MSDESRSLKRRTVLSAAGVGILGSIVSGSGAATTRSDVSTDADETLVGPPEEPIDSYLVATHGDTGEEYVFESTGEVDTKTLPAGEYRLDHYQQTPQSVAVDTEYITIADPVEAASGEATLETKIDYDRGIDSTESLSVWVSATTGADQNISGAANATISFEITDATDNVLLEDQATTNEHGFAFREFDLNLEGGTEYWIGIEWADERTESIHQFGNSSSYVEVGYLSGPVEPNEVVGVPISRGINNNPDPGMADVELEHPDGSTEILSVDINDGGVGIAEFVPDETGEYTVYDSDDSAVSLGSTVSVQNQRFYTGNYPLHPLRDQLVDEPIVHGGFILDDKVRPVSDEPITVELRDLYGDVYDSIETSTDANGRFTVEFDPLSEADSYFVVVQTTDGEEIGSEQVRLNEIEEEEYDPELSVSFDEPDAIPGEAVTATIDLTDAADEPVEGDVTVLERMGYWGPILSIDSVSTNEGGTVQYETTVPETFIEGERFYVEGIADVNGETISDEGSVRIESVDVDLSWGNVEAGGLVEREATLTDRTTDEPLSGENIGMVLARGHTARGGAIVADDGTTDTDGTVNFEFDIPEDVRFGVYGHTLYLPYVSLSMITDPTVLSPFSSSVEIPNEASAGGSFEIEYTVDDHDTDTVGIVFINTFAEAQVEIIGPNESVTVDVPSRMAGDRIRTETAIMDSDGYIVDEYNLVSITDGDTHESGVDQDVFEAVDQDGDGDITLEELVEANIERIDDPNNEVNGVEVTLEELVELNAWRLTG